MLCYCMMFPFISLTFKEQRVIILLLRDGWMDVYVKIGMCINVGLFSKACLMNRIGD